MARQPLLYVIAGPNGAGKSTLYDLVIRPRRQMPFINADIIQRDQLKNPDPQASYEAARIAETERQACLETGMSFVMESVFSHGSKLDLISEAAKLNYQITVFHIGVGSPDLSVARVAKRVERGGHPVPEDKIRARYARNGAIIRKAVEMAGSGFVYDNSYSGRRPRLILSFRDGAEANRYPPLPEWVSDIYDD